MQVADQWNVIFFFSIKLKIEEDGQIDKEKSEESGTENNTKKKEVEHNSAVRAKKVLCLHFFFALVQFSLARTRLLQCAARMKWVQNSKYLKNENDSLLCSTYT